MADNTRLQTMQAAINKLSEHSEAHQEQLAAINQSLASLQAHAAQRAEGSVSANQPHSIFASRFSSGDDVLQWIYRADCFFKIQDILEDQKVDLAAMNLEGKALSWFQLLEITSPIQGWFTLSTAMQIQFGPSQFDNPCEDLLKLKQSSK